MKSVQRQGMPSDQLVDAHPNMPTEIGQIGFGRDSFSSVCRVWWFQPAPCQSAMKKEWSFGNRNHLLAAIGKLNSSMILDQLGISTCHVPRGRWNTSGASGRSWWKMRISSIILMHFWWFYPAFDCWTTKKHISQDISYIRQISGQNLKEIHGFSTPWTDSSRWCPKRRPCCRGLS